MQSNDANMRGRVAKAFNTMMGITTDAAAAGVGGGREGGTLAGLNHSSSTQALNRAHGASSPPMYVFAVGTIPCGDGCAA